MCDEARRIRVTVGPTAVADDPETLDYEGTYYADGRYVNDGIPPAPRTYPFTVLS